LMDYSLALYASHLPLDTHPVVGNNAQLAKGLGLTKLTPFGEYHGIKIGFAGILRNPITFAEVRSRVENLLGSPVAFIGGRKERISSIGVVSGGGAFALNEAIAGGIDLLIIGEPQHEVYHPTQETGLSLIFAGHYATETLGVVALGEHIAKKFNLEIQFLDIPTGM